MLFNVIDKQTGSIVYRYESETPIEWQGMEFATHEHVEQVEIIDGDIVGIASRTWTPREFLARFTQAERIAIRTAAKTNAVLEDYLAILESAQEVRSDNLDTIDSLTMLENAGLLASGRASEILNGG